MQLTGTVVFWRDDKGFGFIVPNGHNANSQDKLFFHIRDLHLSTSLTKSTTKPQLTKATKITSKDYRPQVGDTLNFSLGKDHKGRTIAAPWQPNTATLTQALAKPLAKPAAASQPNSGNTKPAAKTQAQLENIDIEYTKDIALFFRLGFIVLIIIAVLFGTLPYVLPILYIEASLFTFWLYRTDKKAAMLRQRDRLPEQSLQLFSLIGGWPGAYIAQKKLKHKNRKWLFQREFALVILANTLLVIWLISSNGIDFFSQFAFFAG